eukprot:TRINITY_DN38_c0_g1_i1.p1 TRINITY_DN38_c0_g1~~TRINITY_DN38_c0_g1_i1.p1  ORF type:complete len:424 (-),score=71.07 TRINITY_DN38_c0_g1_i1:135-1406(-)
MEHTEMDWEYASSSFPLNQLVPELLVHILSFLSPKELLSLSETCQFYWHLIEQNNRSLWKNITERCWNFSSDRIDVDWRKYYHERGLLQKENSFVWEHLEVIGDKPSARMCHTGIAANGSKIYYIGGQHGQTNRFDGVYVFDTKTRAFQKLRITSPDSPPKFARHVTVNINNKFYSFGGYDGFSNYFGLAIFDPEQCSWIYPVTYGDRPELRTNHAACAIGTKMYIYGGNRTEEDKSYKIYSDLHVLDTTTLTWTKPKTTGDIPGPRVAHKLLTVNNQVYLFGGGVWSPERDWIEKTPYIHVLNPETYCWTQPKMNNTHNLRVASFPIPFVCSYFIFIFGGQDNTGGGEVKDLVCFDTVSLNWTKYNPILADDEGSDPGARSVGTACLNAGKVYLFGGSGEFTLTNNTHQLSHPLFELNPHSN